MVIRTACLFLGNESKTTETNVTRRPAQSVVDQSWKKMAATLSTLPPKFSSTCGATLETHAIEFIDNALTLKIPR